ncbi:MAG: VTT domain-containing protein [Planctomycetes bacterium]|nr:VTT domain-containing protein [Planctomycetota bacterium]
MQATLEFLVLHGYAVVFFWVLLSQGGLPLPAIPLLIAAGALAGSGQLDVFAITSLAVVASLLSDAAWFALGRRKGGKVLRFLCRVSLEPESCVLRTQQSFARRGALTVVFAKFVPGLSTAAPPLAGMVGMRWSRFLWLDAAGALLWTSAFVVPGYVFSDQLERVAANAALTGAWLLGIFGAVIAAFVLAKVVRRQRFLRRLRIARVAPEELQRLLDSDERPFVVDLRHGIDFDADPRVVPGALHFTVEEIEQNHAAIPRDRDVVLYCT